MRLPRLFTACLLWLVCAGAGLTAKEKWIYAKTEHFEIYSSGPEEKSRRMLHELEQFRAGLRAAIGLKMTGEKPVTVLVFASEKEFTKYAPLYKGKARENVGGFCMEGPDRSLLTVNALNWDDAYRTALHEYVHHVIAESGMKPPLWLNEGLATLYEVTQITDKEILFGRPKQSYLRYLLDKPLMSLDRLMGVTHKSPEYNVTEMARAFYSTSWLLTHYLVLGEDAENQKKLTRFLTLMETPGANAADCFEEAMGRSSSRMEEELKTYLKSGKYSMKKTPLPYPKLMDSIRFSAADDISLAMNLTKLRWMVRAGPSNQPGFGLFDNGTTDANAEQECIASLHQIIRLAPTSPKPHELLALIAGMQHTTRPEMRDHLLKAVELGTDNPYVYLYLAKLELQDILGNLSLDYRMPPLVSEPIRRYLDRAIELNPRFFEAWETLAQLEAIAEYPRGKIINRVIELLPDMKRSQRTYVAMATILWRYKKPEKCRELLRGLDAQAGRDKWVDATVNKLKNELEADEEKAKAAAAAAQEN